MRKLKTFGIVLLLAGAAVAGDSCNVNDRLINPIRYRNVKVDPKTYQKPFRLQKKYIQNEQGMLEVHIGHNEKWYVVSKDLRVNERGLEQMMKDQGNEFARAIKEKYEQKQPIIREYINKIIQTYKEIFGEENGRPDKDNQ